MKKNKDIKDEAPTSLKAPASSEFIGAKGEIISIPQETLEQWARLVSEAKNPMVFYNDDVEVMKKDAREYTRDKLNDLELEINEVLHPIPF